MATQATYCDYSGQVRESQAVGRSIRADKYRLREFPHEDVYLYRKAIDNSRVVRQSDPQARKRCVSVIGVTCLATLVLASLLWPNVAGMLAGHEIEMLKQQQQKLLAERDRLEVEEAQLLSPQRLEELARIQQFIDPAPGQVIYLNPKPDGSLAFNRAPK
jgi:hypothetical protein